MGHVPTGSDRLKYRWDRQPKFAETCRQGDLWDQCGTPKGTGREPAATGKEKLTKGLDVMQSRKEQKAGDNKEEKNSWSQARNTKAGEVWGIRAENTLGSWRAQNTRVICRLRYKRERI